MEGGGGGGGGGGEKRHEDRREREQRVRKMGIVFASHSPRPQRGERRQGGQILGAKRKAGARHGQQDERKSNFELYLDTIPRLDPVDRTVGWVFQQHEEAQVYSSHAPYGLCSYLNCGVVCKLDGWHLQNITCATKPMN